jgi:uncharacterized damage-inducible protein DinB
VSGDLIVPEPTEPPLADPELATLEGWLEYHRATLLLTCDGLTGEQRKRRPVPTSLMSLHGMVRHLADVERTWFQRVLGHSAGLPAIFSTAADADWIPLDRADWAADVGSWQAECRRSRLTAAAHGLDDAGVGVRGGQRVTCSLRWIYNHMIEEYARHNGHADLIRELVAGPAVR